jgi:hypothetical protein
MRFAPFPGGYACNLVLPNQSGLVLEGAVRPLALFPWHCLRRYRIKSRGPGGIDSNNGRRGAAHRGVWLRSVRHGRKPKAQEDEEMMHVETNTMSTSPPSRQAPPPRRHTLRDGRRQRSDVLPRPTELLPRAPRVPGGSRSPPSPREWLKVAVEPIGSKHGCVAEICATWAQTSGPWKRQRPPDERNRAKLLV